MTNEMTERDWEYYIQYRDFMENSDNSRDASDRLQHLMDKYKVDVDDYIELELRYNESRKRMGWNEVQVHQD